MIEAKIKFEDTSFVRVMKVWPLQNILVLEVSLPPNTPKRRQIKRMFEMKHVMKLSFWKASYDFVRNGMGLA